MSNSAVTPVNAVQAASASAQGVVTTSAQTFGGAKTFADGIVLDDAAGQTTLNYYQTGSNTGTWSGTTTTPTISADFVRIGNAVTMRVPTGVVTLTKDASPGPLVITGLVPAFAKPSVQVDTTLFVQINNTITLGYVRIKVNGDMEIYNQSFTNIAAGATNCGIRSGVTASWIF